MIDNEKYKKVLSNGLLLDHYFLLCNIKYGVKPVDTKRVQGFVNLLVKKGYIENDQLTDKALELIEDCAIAQTFPVVAKKERDFTEWVTQLHKKCQDKITELTGSAQVRAKVNGKGKGYYFLCNPIDFGKSMLRTINAYKLKDYDKIEKAVLQHIDNCHSSGDWFPLMQYYISKNGTSLMVTDMDSLEVQDTSTYKSTQKLV